MLERRIFFTNNPSNELLDFVEKSFPVDSSSTFIRNRVDLQDAKIKNKRRSNTSRTELKEISSNRRNKTISESSEKDIILDMVSAETPDMKVCMEILNHCII